MPQPEEKRPHIWIELQAEGDGTPIFVCGDEDGEFAQAYSPDTLWEYVHDLIVGPGTLRSGPLPILSSQASEKRR